MVPGTNPVNWLLKEPLVDPSVVFGPAIVGLDTTEKQTPLCCIGAFPFDDIVPPVVAELKVTFDAIVVEIIGTEIASVVNETSFP